MLILRVWLALSADSVVYKTTLATTSPAVYSTSSPGSYNQDTYGNKGKRRAEGPSPGLDSARSALVNPNPSTRVINFIRLTEGKTFIFNFSYFADSNFSEI